MAWNAKELVSRGKNFFSRPILPAKKNISPVNWFSVARILLVTALVYSVGLFYVRTVRPGHRWAGDFSLYVRHAQNIAKGRSYADVRYIQNPYFPTYSPKSYPPVYPAMLAVVHKFRGLNLEAMKYVGIGCFLLTLLLLYAWLWPDLRFAPMFVLLACLGFHPAFWDFKDMLYADLPFLFFVTLVLFLRDKIRERPHPGWGEAAAVGAAMYLACGTRSIGFILVPAILLGDFIRARRIQKTTWRALAVLLAMVALQGIFYNDSGYLSLMSWNWTRTIGNAHDYVGMVMDLWENGQWAGLKMGMFVLTSLSAAAGYFLRLRLGVRDVEVFVPLYCVTVIFWPGNDGVRYLFPVIPFYFYYAFIGLDGLIESGAWRSILLLGWAAAAALTYESVYAQTSFGPFLKNVRAPESVAVFRFIKRTLPEDAVLIAREPRIFALYTARHFSVYHFGSDEDLWNYFHAVKAGYLVTGRNFEMDREFFQAFADRYRKNLAIVFSNYDFKIYKVLSFPE